ncbi:MAG: hypothetical protein JW871_07430 [Endomicrobiales bacterium]|nr:hypothetical protein [Endomicrobiales bacterium]
MKKFALFGVLLLFFAASCEKNPYTSSKRASSPADPLGTNYGAISFYSGEQPGSSSAISRKTLDSYQSGRIESVTVFIDEIAISKTGEEWETVLNTLQEITITTDPTPIRITDPVNVSAGQYEGIRIHIQPKVTFLFSDGTSKTFNKMPNSVGVIKSISKTIQIVETSETITLSTANGYLNAFNVENGSETYIVLDIKVLDMPVGTTTASNLTGWTFAITARPTRFLN